MLSKKMFVKVNQDCFKNANKKQKELFLNLDVLQLKLMLIMLSYSNLINATDKQKTLKTKFKIDLKDFRKKGSLLENVRLTKKELSNKFNSIKHPYFESINASDDFVEFNLKKSYVMDLNTSKSGRIILNDIMSYKSVNQIKMHFQLAYFSNYRIPFYFAINYLGISKNQTRKDQIKAIKNVFKGLKIENDCEYIFPKPREPKDDLHYNFVIKTKKSYTDDVYF